MDGNSTIGRGRIARHSATTARAGRALDAVFRAHRVPGPRTGARSSRFGSLSCGGIDSRLDRGLDAEVSPAHGRSQLFIIFDIDKMRCRSRRTDSLCEREPQHQYGRR
jgi:hypothetical protein